MVSSIKMHVYLASKVEQLSAVIKCRVINWVSFSEARDTSIDKVAASRLLIIPFLMIS